MARREWKRENVWLRLLLSAPTGGGKTFAALALAATLFDGSLPVVAIDTENERMKLYADLVDLADYRVIVGDYSPEVFVKEIDEIEDEFPGAVLIIDSVTHEWNGTGGTLEIVDRGKGSNWKEATPRHNKFTNRIANAQLHVICCVRSKMQYEWTNKDGKVDPKRIGIGPVQRDDFPHGFDIEAEIDAETHLAKITKTRNFPTLDQKVVNLVPDPENLKAANPISQAISLWLSEGEPPKPPEAASDEDVERLRALLLQDGIDEADIDRGFAVACRQNRGVLHPDYVSEKAAAAEKRLATKAELATA